MSAERRIKTGAKAPTPDLLRAYVKGYGRVNNAIHRVKELFERFDWQTGKQGRVDWATVGTLDHTGNELEQIIQELQSAVEATATKTKRRAH